MVSFSAAIGGERPRDGARSNFIFILADDLGYNDVSCYGQTQFSTPNIDRMATEGMRFTSAYASAPLCAPCRATLLTGLHNGHSPIRQNPSQARGYDRTARGDPPLPGNIPTFPKVFREAGYATAAIGKWGMGRADAAGNPDSIGFDYFFGYESHSAAHDYYPEFLWRNREKVPLDGKTYTHDLFTQEALAFIRKNKDRPFFLYLPYTIPHVALNPPSLEPYADKPWPQPDRAYAAMIHRLDADVGRIIALLKELNLDANTLVIFTSDNGPESAGGHKSEFFHSGAPFRGQKNGPYEGGIRVPFIARWPGHVPAAVTTAQPVVHYDMLATAAEFVGASAPARTDGLSILPTLLNESGRQKQHEYFYWALGEVKGGFQEIRLGRWKAEILNVSTKPQPTIELYDLETDVAQARNVAAEHPDIVQRVQKIAAEAHTPDVMFPLTYAECQAAAPKGVTPWPDKAEKKTKKAK
jgi:arylsulfatase A-like enzyme